jgi:hypothetical protein
MKNWFVRLWSPSPRRKAPRPRRRPLRLEWLEDRVTPAIITVNTTADTIALDTFASLREAITSINNGADLNADVTAQRSGAYGANDTINFNIPQPMSGPVVQTINVGITGNGALPAITQLMTINGYTEPGASMNTLANGDNAKILIELNGANAGPNADGLKIQALSTIEGLAINRFSLNGIELLGASFIQGNFVGTNPQGTAAEPNQNDGIRLTNTILATIGGTTPAARNVVSGNQIDGIHIVSTSAGLGTNNLIEGNFVGVAANGISSVGTKAIGGAAGTPAGNFVFGIEISGGDNNTVGGSTAGARNVVGFNAAGIEVDDGGQNNIIQGNFSGVGADGVTPVGNNLHGIVLRSDDNLAPPLGPGQTNEPAVSGNIIGLNPNTNFSGLGNLVEFNGTGGIAIFGNPLPNNATPIQNTGNSILGNSVFENGRSFATASSAPTPLLGIDLTNGFTFPRDDGFTANDSKPRGVANAPNNFQNFPILSSALPVAGGVQISGTFTEAAEPNTTLRLEFYANNPDPLGQPAEGQIFLGAMNVTTNASGMASFTATFNVNLQSGQIITATATSLTADPSAQPGNTFNKFNTSEFSPGITFTLPSPPAPPASGILPPPSVSVAFGPFGEVLEVVGPTGTLTQYDAFGAHVLGGGVRAASVAFGPSGEELLVTFQNGALTLFDATGVHPLGSSGVLSASIAFGPQGAVLEVVSAGGTLTQFDSAGAHVLGGGVSSTSVAFTPGGGEELLVTFQNGALTLFDAAGAHPLVSGGVLSAGLSFDATGAAVVDVLTLDGTLRQIDSAGTRILGKVF